MKNLIVAILLVAPSFACGDGSGGRRVSSFDSADASSDELAPSGAEAGLPPDAVDTLDSAAPSRVIDARTPDAIFKDAARAFDMSPAKPDTRPADVYVSTFITDSGLVCPKTGNPPAGCPYFTPQWPGACNPMTNTMTVDGSPCAGYCVWECDSVYGGVAKCEPPPLQLTQYLNYPANNIWRGFPGGPCGEVDLSNGVTGLQLTCVRSVCELAGHRVAGIYSGDVTFEADGICRAYCESNSSCAHGCVHEDLPCPVHTQGPISPPAPIPGIGLCAL